MYKQATKESLRPVNLSPWDLVQFTVFVLLIWLQTIMNLKAHDYHLVKTLNAGHFTPILVLVSFIRGGSPFTTASFIALVLPFLVPFREKKDKELNVKIPKRVFIMTIIGSILHLIIGFLVISIQYPNTQNMFNFVHIRDTLLFCFFSFVFALVLFCISILYSRVKPISFRLLGIILSFILISSLKVFVNMAIGTTISV